MNTPAGAGIDPDHFSILYHNRVYLEQPLEMQSIMTNIGDVIRQIEKATCDPDFPLDPHQQEVLNRMLVSLYSGTVEFVGGK